MSLFMQHKFIRHSGEPAYFKIECDDLSYSDMQTLCEIISKKYSFHSVRGVPTGGLKIEQELLQYRNDKAEDFLIVDDVLTTGASMNQAREEISRTYTGSIQGVVLFAIRPPNCDWVDSLFTMWD